MYIYIACLRLFDALATYVFISICTCTSILCFHKNLHICTYLFTYICIYMHMHVYKFVVIYREFIMHSRKPVSNFLIISNIYFECFRFNSDFLAFYKSYCNSYFLIATPPETSSQCTFYSDCFSLLKVS